MGNIGFPIVAPVYKGYVPGIIRYNLQGITVDITEFLHQRYFNSTTVQQESIRDAGEL